MRPILKLTLSVDRCLVWENYGSVGNIKNINSSVDIYRNYTLIPFSFQSICCYH